MGRNPLRRRSDRIEAAAVLAALVLTLAAVPAATTFGTSVHHHELTVSAHQNAASHPTAAVLLQRAPVMAGPRELTTIVAASARWFAPAGVRHVDRVQAREGAAVRRVGPRVARSKSTVDSSGMSPLRPTRGIGHSGEPDHDARA
jgi:hypothetical protein